MEIRQVFKQSLRLDSWASLSKEVSFGNKYKWMDERESVQCVCSFVVSYRAKTPPVFCSSLSNVSHSFSFRTACLVSFLKLCCYYYYYIIYYNVLIWETSTWFMILEIEITSGFHPLQVFASIDVFIIDQKVHAESAFDIFVLFALLTSCRGKKLCLNHALKLLKSRQVT